jgi:hypothetical protein
LSALRAPRRPSVLGPLLLLTLAAAAPRARATDAAKAPAPAKSSPSAKPPAAAKGAAPAPAPAAEPEAAAKPPATRALPGLTPRPAPAPDAPKAPADRAERRAWLKTHIDEALASPALAKAKVGMLAIEADTGKPLYARAEKTPLNAASNVKIVTSAAALSLLGPEYRWRTTLSVAAPPGGPALPPGGEIRAISCCAGAATLAVRRGSQAGADPRPCLRKVHGGPVVDDTFDGATVPRLRAEYRLDRFARPCRRRRSAATSYVTIIPARPRPGAS